MSAVGIGIIGVGVISDTYLENLGAFPDTEVLILGDLDLERARAQAEKYGIPGQGSAEDVLAHRGVLFVARGAWPVHGVLVRCVVLCVALDCVALNCVALQHADVFV